MRLFFEIDLALGLLFESNLLLSTGFSFGEFSTLGFENWCISSSNLHLFGKQYCMFDRGSKSCTVYRTGK